MAKTAPNIPRETLTLIGQPDAECQLMQAYASGKLPHAWLLSGPKGLGKATLAHRFARFLLAENARKSADSLEVDAANPAVRRVMGGSHADFMVLEAEEGGTVTVEEVRALGEFLSRTPAEGRWRVVIVDPADAMNANAANAILKTLEEPPARAVLLLVSHNPGSLLPTIRSRCRVLKLSPHQQADFIAIVNEHSDAPEDEKRACYHLADGSPGIALFLLEQGALPLYQALLEIFLPPRREPDWVRTHALAGQLAGKNDMPYFEAFQHTLQRLFRQLVKASELGEAGLDEEILDNEHAVLLHMASFKSAAEWLELWSETSRLLHDVRRIHLDRKQAVLTIVAAIQPQRELAAG